MDVHVSRAQIPDRGSDPHDWNSYENYVIIHDKYMSQHPFIDHSRQHTLRFLEPRRGQEAFLRMEGTIYLQSTVVLDVLKLFESRIIGGIQKIRGVLYRYAAWEPDGNALLRYHNLHKDPSDFIHRVYDLDTGEEQGYERLARYQLPTLSEVIDEIQYLVANRLIPDHPTIIRPRPTK